LFGLSLTQRYRSILASFSLNRTGEYIAPVFPENFRFPGFPKADLFISYERALTDRFAITFFGGADNILDRTYFENGFRAPGAVGKGGFSLRF
jgi:outer membrane receptor protein involved in Fe transport